MQQIVECDKQLFTMASIEIDAAILRLSKSNEVLQYLTPFPQARAAGSKDQPDHPAKKPKVAPKGSQKGGGKYSIPEGCVSKDDQNRPLCFAFQHGKCLYKGPKQRCASAQSRFARTLTDRMWGPVVTFLQGFPTMEAPRVHLTC